MDNILSMLIHPWDAANDADEWKTWLAEGRDFGQLIAAGSGRDLPIVVPTHFLYDGDATIRLHLARPNPVWAAFEERPRALLTVIDDYVYAPAEWAADEGQPVEEAIPTSYYATLQLSCGVRVIDDPAEKAEILNAQLGHFEPPGSKRLPVGSDDRNLSGIRGIELAVTDARAKFKYAGNKKTPVRARIAEGLTERGSAADHRALGNLMRRHPLESVPAPSFLKSPR
jgi:transcriptional regulator